MSGIAQDKVSHFSYVPPPQEETSHLLGLIARLTLPEFQWRPQESGGTL